MLPTTTIVVLLSLCLQCSGSSGDKSSEYKFCVKQCFISNCRSSELPFMLLLLGWSCHDDCGYHCMIRITQEDINHNREVRQFSGKWPFIRILGVQEPASVLFSLFNAVTVATGYHHFAKNSPSDYHLHGALFVQLLVSLNTWLWSTVFHTRDLYWTERMDYFSAALFIVCGLIVQFIRLSGKRAIFWQWIYGIIWLLLYLLHISYLSMGRFNYGYNMAACVIAGTLYSVIWTAWSIKEWRKRYYVWKCLLVVIWSSCTVLLELLDFPPLLWLLDAHALWHLSTVPVPLLWYSFLVDDAKYEAELKSKNV